MRVPVRDLVDLDALGSGGRPPTPRRIREALPPGWVLDEDGITARRDLRVLARDGWVLLSGLVCFGIVGLAFFWDVFPRGWAGALRLVVLLVTVLLAGGIIAPTITRALNRR